MRGALDPWSASELAAELATRELEDPELIATIDALLSRRRGHVFAMPPPGSPVVFQMSGGTDSLVTASYLMGERGLTLYPLFLKRGHDRCQRELDAIEAGFEELRARHPGQLMPLFAPEVRVPPLEMRRVLIGKANQRLAEGSNQRRGIPMYATLLAAYSVQFGYWLEASEGIVTRTVLCSAHADDGRQMAHHTITGLRAAMLDACAQTQDWHWQLSSPWIEPALGRFATKAQVLAWGHQRHLPLHETWSCYRDGEAQCGTCLGCQLRRDAFTEAGVADSTRYLCFEDGEGGPEGPRA